MSQDSTLREIALQHASSLNPSSTSQLLADSQKIYEWLCANPGARVVKGDLLVEGNVNVTGDVRLFVPKEQITG